MIVTVIIVIAVGLAVAAAGALGEFSCRKHTFHKRRVGDDK